LIDAEVKWNGRLSETVSKFLERIRREIPIDASSDKPRDGQFYITIRREKEKPYDNDSKQTRPFLLEIKELNSSCCEKIKITISPAISLIILIAARVSGYEINYKKLGKCRQLLWKKLVSGFPRGKREISDTVQSAKASLRELVSELIRIKYFSQSETEEKIRDTICLRLNLPKSITYDEKSLEEEMLKAFDRVKKSIS